MVLSTAFIGTKHYNKYGNKKITTPDGVFDSKYEYEEWCRLKLLEKSGIISNLRRQVELELIPTIKTSAGTLKKIIYKADFFYNDGDGNHVIYESKGYKTRDYMIKKRLLIKEYVLEKKFIFIESVKGKKTIYKKDNIK